MIDHRSSGGEVPPDRADVLEALAGDEARWSGVTCVALLRREGAGPESLAAVRRLARTLGRHRRVFLLNLERPGSGLDERLSASGRPGLAAVRRGERKVGEATVRPRDERFLYLPAGAGAGTSAGRPAEDPAVVELVGRLRDKMEEAGWLLLVLAAPEDTTALEGVLDGHVLLEPELEAGPAAGPEIGGPEGDGEGTATAGGAAETGDEGEADGPAEERGATEPAPGERPSEEPEGNAAGEAAQWRRHRRRDGPPVRRIVLAALVLVALAGGWWWLAGRAGDAAREADAGVSGRQEAAAGPADSAVEAPVGADVAAGPGTEGTATVPTEAPELGYSVLVASYGSAELALGRTASWSDGVLYFAAPTPVRGATYWRVYAGALAAPAAAEALNRRLAASGRKDSARAWDVRPVPLAFRAGTFAAESEANRRAATLRQEGVPAYVVPAAADGDTAWQVYAGAYESEEAAAALRPRLTKAGVEAELVTRRGEPSGP